jgi:hypothetical protein
MIIDDKNPNTFLVCIELYLTKIQKKSRRGRIQVGYDNGNWFPGRANMGYGKNLIWDRVGKRVRSGLGRVRQVKMKSLSGAVGLSWDRLAGPSGLGSGKAKSLSEAGLALPLTSG